MDQLYFVGRPNEDGRRSVFYRYGNFCYADVLRVDNCNDMRKLPSVMQHLQSVQASRRVFVRVYVTACRRRAPRGDRHCARLRPARSRVEPPFQ
jgi:hypothetical protein